MKIVKNLFVVFALICLTSGFIACEPNSTDEEAYEDVLGTTGNQEDEDIKEGRD